MRRRISWLVGFGVLVIVTAACYRPAGQPVLPGPSAGTQTRSPARPAGAETRAVEPAPTVTPSPSATPVPSPTPTPTRSPAQLMDEAEQALHQGEYGAAVAAYGALHDRGLDETTDSDCLIGLGRAHARAGSYEEAVEAFSTLLTGYPDSQQTHRARFLLGDAYLGAGNPISAAHSYESYLQAGTVITPYVSASLGDALRAAGVYTSARQAYERAIDEAPSRAFEAEVREKTALAWVAQEQYAAAVDEYDAILGIAQNPEYRAEIGYTAAETLLLAGDSEAAYARYAQVVENYRTEEHAYLSLVRLVEAGRPVDDFLRGVVDYYGEAYVPAVQALYRYIYAFPETHSGDAHWYAGLSYLESDSLDLAANEFELLIDTHPESERRGEAWLKLAEVRADQGLLTEAVDTYRAFVQTNPDDALAPQALWDAGRLLERTGELEDSSTAYLDCEGSYPESDLAAGALFRAGLQFYQMGEQAEAAEAWEGVRELYPDSDDHLPALFWLGKASLEQGDTERGMEMLTEAASSAPDAYYGLRAAELLATIALEGSQEPESTQAPDDGPQQSAEEWLAAWLGLEDVEELAKLSPRLADNPRWRRGRELWALDRFQEAKTELEALRTQTYSNPLDQYQLAHAYADLGLYRSSILSAWRLIGLAPISATLEAPRSILALAYPTYYEDLVLENAQASGLDPLLVFSLIRQESLFESLATSSASAHGLMQVIPPTGREIAADLNWPPGYATSDLYLPYVSLRFGIHYLAKQRDRFNGRIDVALAAYNGGPGNAQRWLERAGDDPDLFLEKITFSETRLYLRRIRESLAVYRALYPESE